MAGAGANAAGSGAAVVVGAIVVVGAGVVVVVVVVLVVVGVGVVVVLVVVGVGVGWCWWLWVRGWVVVLAVVPGTVVCASAGRTPALQRRCNQTSGHQGVTTEASAAFQCTLPVRVGLLIARRRIQIIALAVLGHPASRGIDRDRRGWWRVRTARSS
jgi:hypothetical protein